MGKTGRHWGSDLNQQGHFSQPLFLYDFFFDSPSRNIYGHNLGQTLGE